MRLLWPRKEEAGAENAGAETLSEMPLSVPEKTLHDSGDEVEA